MRFLVEAEDRKGSLTSACRMDYVFVRLLAAQRDNQLKYLTAQGKRIGVSPFSHLENFGMMAANLSDFSKVTNQVFRLSQS